MRSKKQNTASMKQNVRTDFSPSPNTLIETPDAVSSIKIDYLPSANEDII